MSKNKTEYTPTEALKHLQGISRTALYDDMNNGSLPYSSSKQGKRSRRVIQGVDLARVYGDKFYPEHTEKTSETDKQKHIETFGKQSKTTNENSLLEKVINTLEKELAAKDAIITDMSSKLDTALNTINGQALLEDKRIRQQKSHKWPLFFGTVFMLAGVVFFAWPYLQSQNSDFKHLRAPLKGFGYIERSTEEKPSENPSTGVLEPSQTPIE